MKEWRQLNLSVFRLLDCIEELESKLKQSISLETDIKRKLEYIDKIKVTIKKSLSAFEAIESAFTCFNCFKMLTDPQLLSCGHSICGGCMILMKNKLYCENCHKTVSRLECQDSKLMSELSAKLIFSKQCMNELTLVIKWY